VGGNELILLDTHVWLWLAGGRPTLSPSARALILEASAQDALFLSPISLWEIALKSSRGKLELHLPLRHWMQQAVDLTAIHLLPISVEIACDCADLPAAFHGDPADRIIAASARATGFTLLTHDKALLQLGSAGHFKAVAT